MPQLSRIVAPDDVLMVDVDDNKEDHEIVSVFFSVSVLAFNFCSARNQPNTTLSSFFYTPQRSALHDHTYGITSDPLTQFAVSLL